MSACIPRGLRQIRAVYGNIKVTDDRIVSPKGWAEQHIVLLVSPKFRACGPTKIWCHELVAPELGRILKRIQALEAVLNKPLIYSIDGCWVVRAMRRGGKISTHAWGIAIDINAARNPMGAKSTQSQAMVEVFEDAGWEWGGRWRNPDPMHMQRCSGY